MKRIIAMLLVVVCLFSLMSMLTACGGSGKNYTCGYCGYKMGSTPYSYIMGQPVCWRCYKNMKGK